MTKYIPLTQGKVALVDDEDWEWLTQWKWQCHYKSGYAGRRTYTRGKIENRPPRRYVTMHRFIMGEPYGLEVDHRNGNRLDNRRSNLRVVTSKENKFNKGLYKNSNSGIKGVRFHRGKWEPRLRVNGRLLYLGVYTNREDAIVVRQAAEIKYFGDYRRVDNR